MQKLMSALLFLSVFSSASFAAGEFSYDCLDGELKIDLSVPTGLAPWYLSVAWTKDAEKRRFGQAPPVVFNALSNTTAIEFDRGRLGSPLAAIFVGNLRFSHTDDSLVVEKLKGIPGLTSSVCRRK